MIVDSIGSRHQRKDCSLQVLTGKNQNDAFNDLTLKGTGVKAFGFHRTAITVPP